MPKFSLGKLFCRYWALLGICCVLLGVALCFGVELRTAPSERETFSMFLDLDYGSVDDEAISNRVKEIDPRIKRAGAFSFSPSSDEYETYYSAWGANCDLFLFSADYLEGKDMGEFAPLTSLGASETYQIDGVSYGIKAHLGENPYFPLPEGAYYCFFRKTSVHLGSLSESSQSDLCLTLAKELFHAI